MPNSLTQAAATGEGFANRLLIGHAAIGLSALPRMSADPLVGAALRRLGDGDPDRLARTCRLAARRLMRRIESARPPDRDALKAALMMEDIG